MQWSNSSENARSYIGITSRTYIPARSMSNFSFSVRYLLQFRFWPHRRNWHVILRQHATFHQYRITSGGDMASYRFSRWRPLYRNSSSGFLFVDVTLTSEGQCLPANQISSTYLNSWPKYNYFRFGRTNVRILEFYFRFRYHCNRHAILHQAQGIFRDLEYGGGVWVSSWGSSYFSPFTVAHCTFLNYNKMADKGTLLFSPK